MVVRKTFFDRVFDMINILILVILTILTLYPFWHILMASFSDSKELMTHSGVLLKPVGLSFGSYKAVLKNPSIVIGYKNTLVYVIVGTIFNIFMTSLGAYILSRKDFFWKKYIMTMIVITMFFGGGLIPTFLMIKGLGLLNTVWVMIIPGAISTWNLIIMRTAFQSIPDSLEEAAKIDGANDLHILFKIVLPLSIPTIAVMVLYYGVSHWNAWFNAMIYLRNRELYPLQLFLREILISNSVSDMTHGNETSDIEAISETIKYATIIVSTVPILLVYPFLQKYFTKGVMVGAIKG